MAGKEGNFLFWKKKIWNFFINFTYNYNIDAGPFWVHFWSIFDPFGVHLGSIFGPFMIHLGTHLGPPKCRCSRDQRVFSLLVPFFGHFLVI